MQLSRAPAAGLVFVAVPVEAAPGDYYDDFTGALDAGWTIRDGYADQFPADTANHATIAPAGDHLSLSFPAGAEHNQWWLQRQAEVQRPYLGAGTYQIKVDSPLVGDEQVGLSFETSPGTFMQFMLYSTSPGYVSPSEVYAYAERFVNTGGTQVKATVAGASTGLVVPQAGPWYLRVTVDDDADPLNRTWTFEWSLDVGCVDCTDQWRVGDRGRQYWRDPAGRCVRRESAARVRRVRRPDRLLLIQHGTDRAGTGGAIGVGGGRGLFRHRPGGVVG